MLFKCRAGIAGCRFECYFSSDNVRLLITGEVFVRVKLERRAGPATVIAFALLTERNKFFRAMWPKIVGNIFPIKAYL